jgi:putative hydrolase of the HAD superfamily
MRYPVVLLDVGETLIGPRRGVGSIYAAALAELGVSVDRKRVEAALHMAVTELQRDIPEGTDRYRHFPGGEDEYWLRLVSLSLTRAMDRPPEPSLFARAFTGIRAAFDRAEAWEVFADVRPSLDLLRDQGVRLAVVSNWDSRLPQVLRTVELDHYFEVVGVSQHEGVEKPAPALFERVLERLGVRPDEALHVGDRPDTDLAGAKSAGIDAVLIDRRGRFPHIASARSDLTTLAKLARDGLS